ncbi:30 kDa heat shock protein [Naviculisporaceae sp. PSN 640]
MMSIFGNPFCAPQTHYSSEPSLVPLFRLLNDFDHYSRELLQPESAPQPKRRRQSPAPLPRFKPKFDVRETENTYELHGELPGIEKENLNIEFTDPRTIEIRGRVERTKEQQPQPEEEEEEEHQPEVTEPTTPEPEKTTNSHRATVEDDPEEASSTASWTPVSSPKPEAIKPANAEANKKNNNTEVQKAAPKKVAKNAGKIWLWERSIGEFSRVFEFPGDVDHDGVSASLNNGVLTVTVPKKTQRGPRRIAIL